MNDLILEWSQRMEFTDLSGAIEEAHFMDEKHGRTYMLVQLMLGGVNVVKATDVKDGRFLYSTRRDDTFISNEWPKLRSMTLARHHQDAA